MGDLSQSVEKLVETAKAEPDPRTLRPVVEKVLDGFDGAPPKERDAAIKAIGKALGKIDGHGAQVLCLAIGALVESGASPELAWPHIVSGFPDLLLRATAFATAALREAKVDLVEVALEEVGASVAKKKPREAIAWKAIPARCLAAVACLTRSKKLRKSARKDDSLLQAAWPLSDVVAEVGDFLQALRIIDDEKLTILAPAMGRGWRVSIDAIASNLELYLLIADAVCGDAKKGRVALPRPDAKAIAAMREGTTAKKPLSYKLPFLLIPGAVVDAEGSVPSIDPDSIDDWIATEGVPADIPRLDDERIVLLQESPFGESVLIAPSFDTLRPSLAIDKELSPGDVTRIMVLLASLAAQDDADEADAKTKAKATKKKTSAKKKTAKATTKTKTKKRSA